MSPVVVVFSGAKNVFQKFQLGVVRMRNTGHLVSKNVRARLIDTVRGQNDAESRLLSMHFSWDDTPVHHQSHTHFDLHYYYTYLLTYTYYLNNWLKPFYED